MSCSGEADPWRGGAGGARKVRSSLALTPATVAPAEVRAQFLLDEAELGRELIRMTDHRRLATFAEPVSDAALVRAPVNRLVVDVERFADDADEPMAARGMGALYTVTSQLTPLRRHLSPAEREALMQVYYRPHPCPAGSRRDDRDRAPRALPADRLPQLSERGAALRAGRSGARQAGHLHWHR